MAKKPLPMRYCAVIPFEGSQLSVGPFTAFKTAEGVAKAYNGYVLPMLRIDRFGGIEQRDDFKLDPKED